MLVNRNVQDARCLCPYYSSATSEVRALRGQSRVRPLAQYLPCLTGLCQVLQVMFAGAVHCCRVMMLSSVCAGPEGGCEGLPEFEGCFLRVNTSSCNRNL